MPHVIYGYTEQTYSEGRLVYGFTLGLFWLQYAINIIVYVCQRDQYWKAYKDYINEVIIPLVTLKPISKETDISSNSEYTMQRVQELCSNSGSKPLASSRP